MGSEGDWLGCFSLDLGLVVGMDGGSFRSGSFGFSWVTVVGWSVHWWWWTVVSLCLTLVYGRTDRNYKGGSQGWFSGKTNLSLAFVRSRVCEVTSRNRTNLLKTNFLSQKRHSHNEYTIFPYYYSTY